MTTDTTPQRLRGMASESLRHGAVLVIPLVLVNAFAVYGQALWALDNITDRVEVAVLFATALESIGLFLAAEAHSALMAGDAAFRLRLASYAVAGLVGGLNYSHWAPDWTANPKAVTFAALSTVSPWLWSVRSRSMHRAELRARGLIDARTVRFSMARWMLYPWPTLVAYRRAVWVGETDPVRAALLGRATVTHAIPEDRGVEPTQTPKNAEQVQPAVSDTTEDAKTLVPACRPQPRKRPKVAGGRPDRGADVARILATEPSLTQPEVAKRLGCSVRTVQRAWPADRSPLVPVRERTGS